MKNEKTAKRLSMALSTANMKPQELADKSGVSKSSISQYINGSHAPSNLSSGKMGEVLNVDPLWLMGFDVPIRREDCEHDSFKFEPNEINLIRRYRTIDQFGKETVDMVINRELQRTEQIADMESRLRSGPCASEPPGLMHIYPYMRKIASAGTGFYFDDIPTDTISAPYCPRADFVIGVNGDSMVPTFCDGDLVYVQKCDIVKTGEIGIFIVRGECFIKEAGKEGLVSHNEQYPLMPGNEETNCVGRVLGRVNLTEDETAD